MSDELTNIWTQRFLGIDLSMDSILNKISDSDVAYICDNIYPFVQLINPDALFIGTPTAKIITLPNGWTVLDYGDAICTSAPHPLKEPKQSEDGDDGSSGAGTVTGQQEVTAEALAEMIAEKGWASVELMAGTAFMQKMMWIKAKKYGLELKGYKSSVSDERTYERMMRRAKAMGYTWGPSENIVKVRSLRVTSSVGSGS